MTSVSLNNQVPPNSQPKKPTTKIVTKKVLVKKESIDKNKVSEKKPEEVKLVPAIVESDVQTITESDAPISDIPKQRKEKNTKKPKRIVLDNEKCLVLLYGQLDLLMACDVNTSVSKYNRIKKHIQKYVAHLKENNDALQKYINNKPSKQSGSGFMKKVPITDELREFGIKYGGWDKTKCDKMSRVDATKAICSHIQQGGLFDEADKRNIKVSSEMMKLLKLDEFTKHTTYPVIQKLIQTHFRPDVPTPVPVST
tara:strand:- start:7297 stop:8058 length:762 start_codon:yes stop_codon:yes gene_type:complete